MYKLVALFLLAVVAVASAGYLSYGHAYDHAYFGAGAYGSHGPFAVSYNARVDAPREDLLHVASHVAYPYAYHHF